MIVILCDSYQDAKDGYDIFMDYLEHHEPWEIKEVYNSCQCVETWDDLRYIFVYYRCADAFLKMKPDIMSLEEFFESLPGFYDE